MSQPKRKYGNQQPAKVIREAERLIKMAIDKDFAL